MILKKGDYVLATKWNDGDPGDQWCVGFYDEFRNGRHYVVDSDGEQFRLNGFRRAMRISKNRGLFILANRKEIDSGAKSLLWWSRRAMNN